LTFEFCIFIVSLYELPKINLPRFSPKIKSREILLVILIVFCSAVFGFLAANIWTNYFYLTAIEPLLNQSNPASQIISPTLLFNGSEHEQAIVKVVETVSPAVVSIIISKDMPIFEQYYVNPFEEFFGPSPFQLQIPEMRQKGVEKKEIGGGTGFIISEDGLILTNKHVVIDEEAEYTVLTNDGDKFQAKVLAKDPFQDLAVLKIEKTQEVNQQGEVISKPFLTVKLGNSDRLKIGQTAVAIGNSLGEFRNTVSVGVISGLGRTVTATGAGLTETLENLIQTDAAINKGNSGGPLLNLKGEVIGINVAMSEGAESIGFAIPINQAKKAIEQVKTGGKIVYPYLGVYYCLIDEQVKKDYGLSVDYGAWVGRDRFCKKYDQSVMKETPAEKAGLKDGDIILELNNEKITTDNSLAKVIQKYNPGDKVGLKILRDKTTLTIEVILSERED
jgi:S1-C subfamily serine protease